MSKTRCTICGQDAIPLYGRIKVQRGDREVFQFVRAGTWCPNRDCGSIYTDFGVYTRDPTTLVMPVLRELLRKNQKDREKPGLNPGNTASSRI